jgi:two-component system, chemotaxis family, CheB/CheR fusion protein
MLSFIQNEGCASGCAAYFNSLLITPPIQGLARSPAHASSLAQDAMRLRVLVVDDLPDSADTLALLLREQGHEVFVAYNGEEALASAARLLPNVVLLDLSMPGLSGYEVCRRIRAQDWGRSVSVFAQSGWGREIDIRRTEEAGFDRHLLKPLDIEELLVILASLSSPPSET